MRMLQDNGYLLMPTASIGPVWPVPVRLDRPAQPTPDRVPETDQEPVEDIKESDYTTFRWTVRSSNGKFKPINE